MAVSILAASALSAAESQTPSITVVARKVRPWRSVLIVGKANAIRCQIIRSSGDAALDAKGCGEMLACYAAEEPKFATAKAPTLTSLARRRILTAANRELSACFAQVNAHVAVYALDGQAAPAAPDPSHDDAAPEVHRPGA